MKFKSKPEKLAKSSPPQPPPSPPSSPQPPSCGCVGLENLGNTCFMNSCIQILCHTYELNDCLKNTRSSQQGKSPDGISPEGMSPEGKILSEWLDLIQEMWKYKCSTQKIIISPKKFHYFVRETAKQLNNDLFSGWSQNDFTEFLFFIIDMFHKHLKNTTPAVQYNINPNDPAICNEYMTSLFEKDHSPIFDLFYGVYKSCIIGMNGTCHSVRPESFFILDLLPISTDFQTCLRTFTNEEILENENAWFNEKTGKRENIIKKNLFWKFPPILIISFKRTLMDGSINNTCVNFPFNMTILTTSYTLYAVCNHIGNQENGHYYSFINIGDGDSTTWHFFNDEDVKPICKENIVTPYAYCLFYRTTNNKKLKVV